MVSAQNLRDPPPPFGTRDRAGRSPVFAPSALAMAPPADGAAALPPKYKKDFDQVVQFYELKQHKQGVRVADQILKKFPNHGETLSMKGLILSCMDRAAEAHELAKAGLKNDVRSHVCWHVYGLIHRGERNYREAQKCYRMALKLDSGNLMLLRDLSCIQMQLRDLDGFVATRKEILQYKPGSRQNWMALSVGEYYRGARAEALKVIEEYEKSFEGRDELKRGDDPHTAAYEVSEMHMFRAFVLEENGEHEAALDVLTREATASKIVDAIGRLEQMARLHASLGRAEDAARLYRELVDRMPDNHRWHAGLRDAILKGASAAEPSAESSSVERLAGLYAELAKAHPRSDTIRRLPLDFFPAGDPRFRAALAAYVQKPIRKGVPSLFRDLRGLHEDPEKRRILGEVIAETADSLRRLNKFPDAAEAEPDPDACLTHATILHAYHLDRVGDRESALKVIDDALAIARRLCPEPERAKESIAIECLLAKASFLKRAGDFDGAADVADDARQMDLSDRYLNSVCVKRMLQCGRHEDAERLAALFARDGDQASNLAEMQCAWFEIEAGACHAARGRHARALKYYASVCKHYDDMEEDQYDFHAYCLRKMTLRSYVEMLRAEDALYSRKDHRRAAAGAARAYVAAHERRERARRAEAEALAALGTKEERQKFRKDQKKASEREDAARKKALEDEAARARANAEAAQRLAETMHGEGARRKKKTNNEANKKDQRGGEGKKAPDPDPLGFELEASADLLRDAEKLLEPLVRHAGEFAETHALAYAVAWRRGTSEAALRAAEAAARARAVAPDSVAAMRDAAHLASRVASGAAFEISEARAAREANDADNVGAAGEKDSTKVDRTAPPAMDEKTRLGIEDASKRASDGLDPRALAERALALAETPGDCAIAAEMFVVAGAEDFVAKAKEAAGKAKVEGARAKACVAALAAFEEVDRGAADAFKERCAIAFPRCPAFK